MTEHAPRANSGEAGAQRNAHVVLLEFAATAESGAVPSPEPLTEELESIICHVAKTGAASGYPWDALRLLLARKLEHVLCDFWRDAPDVHLPEGQSFETVAVEPLSHALLEPRREGAPFTAQRLCELLAEPRLIYKSTRKYLYAVQRAILVTVTEEALVQRPPARMAPAVDARSAVDHPATNGQVAESEDFAAVTADCAAGANTAGRKRKLPAELSNGVVSE
mmetsp:Transcript_21181/g.41395  ORF Transcript_21181/g.41395 Transcript_21181/m.41395 type:complete len:222 (-) Transcript_21181:142-807(-)|eukprot:CAMPEP_0172728652 /NCGR_PEP_ID=MMETSP1074-20121228/92362_1 /TAXON_ID=2916 /ORGANISM="Ceratium fusus, Strain PA161109" /LENGTH=221 /DNA_ID=CAMNT_0013555921 /DNA_START=59 /DNA_END=724 /DNA_ORIENTATION=-